MRTPWDRLEAFETKHGAYHVLLDEYCRLSSPPDALRNVDERAAVERARQRLSKHQMLVAEVIGYALALRHGQRMFAAVGRLRELAARPEVPEDQRAAMLEVVELADKLQG